MTELCSDSGIYKGIIIQGHIQFFNKTSAESEIQVKLSGGQFVQWLGMKRA